MAQVTNNKRVYSDGVDKPYHRCAVVYSAIFDSDQMCVKIYKITQKQKNVSMKETIKQTAELIAEHPKATIAVTTLFTSHAWLNYGEPIIKGLTSVVGLFVLIALLVKHVLDIKKSIKDTGEK